jgi:hypothetical protein
MNVRIEDREEIATAVIASRPWAEALDEIWAYMRANGIRPGRNVMLYDGDRREVGVELEGFEGAGAIFASTLPGGPTVVALRRGELSADGIAEARAAAREWAAATAVELTGACWEIYGHMNEQDPADFELLVGWPCADRTSRGT